MRLRRGVDRIRRAWIYTRFLRDLPEFLRRRMGLEEAGFIFHRRMAERSESFLDVVRRGIFEYEDSPYLPLLRLAGCEYADIEKGVRRNGLEATLEALRDEGVYVTYEEFTRRAPLVRAGHEIRLGQDPFVNPLLNRYYDMSTGGSTGAARRVAIDLEHLWARVPEQVLSDTIHGFTGKPLALWFSGIPANAVNSLLTRVAFDNLPERWFTPAAGRDTRPLLDLSALRWRLAERGILTVARLSGVRLPPPESARLEQAVVVARWAAEVIERHGACGVKTMLSRALRLALAAEEEGLDLTGLTLSGGGEPPTPAKAAAIKRCGATLVCNYHMQEVGAIGKMCANPVDENDQHLMLDHLALITRRREVPGFDLKVDAFCFTTLLPSARNLMLNVEVDDYGVIERRDCGCPWEEFGLKTHLREIRSFRKLTGEGVTIVGTDMMRILEEVLPSRFGGSALDYQFLEEEDERGFTRLSIIVSPRVAEKDDQAIVASVLDSLPRANRALWGEANLVRVRRQEPVWTGRGKLMPLHLARRGGLESPDPTPARILQR